MAPSCRAGVISQQDSGILCILLHRAGKMLFDQRDGLP